MVQATRVAAVLCIGFCVVIFFQLRAVVFLLSTPALPPEITQNARNSLRGSLLDNDHHDDTFSLPSTGHDLVDLQQRLEDVVQSTKEKLVHGAIGPEAVEKAKNQIDELRAEVEHKTHLIKVIQSRQKQQQQQHVESPKSERGSGGGGGRSSSRSQPPSSNRPQPSSHSSNGGGVAIANVNDGSSMYAPTVTQRSLGLDSPLLVLCYSRDDYLTRTLETILKYHPTRTGAGEAVADD